MSYDSENKITDVALDSLSLLYLDGDEVVVLLKFLPRGILVEKSVADFLEAQERPR